MTTYSWPILGHILCHPPQYRHLCSLYRCRNVVLPVLSGNVILLYLWSVVVTVCVCCCWSICVCACHLIVIAACHGTQHVFIYLWRQETFWQRFDGCSLTIVKSLVYCSLWHFCFLVMIVVISKWNVSWQFEKLWCNLEGGPEKYAATSFIFSLKLTAFLNSYASSVCEKNCRSGGMFNDHFFWNFLQSADGKILKIGQYSAKMWTKVCSWLFWLTLSINYTGTLPVDRFCVSTILFAEHV